MNEFSKLNILGHKFGRLFVLGPSENINGRTAWLCSCDCGNIKIVKTEYLRSGDTKSCGCLNTEHRKTMFQKRKNKRKHEPIISSAMNVWKDNYTDGLTFEEFFELSQQNCFYCNSPPSNSSNVHIQKHSSKETKELGLFIYNGLDRIDSSKPHTKDNVVPCCKYCNFAKKDQSFQDYIEYIKTCYKYMKDKYEK